MKDLFYALGSIEGLVIVIVSIFIAFRIATIIDMLMLPYKSRHHFV